MEGSYTYTIELEARDVLEEDSRTTSVSTAFTLMSWGPDGRSIGLGKVAEKANTLEVALGLEVTGQAHFEDSVNFAGKVTGSVNDAIKDYVIETGTESMGSNGTWYWTKWASGKAECYGCRNYGNMAVSTAWNSSLYISNNFAQSLPSGLFANTPEFINITPSRISTSLWVIYGGATSTSATSTGTFQMCRGTSGTVSQVYLGFHVIGRWK